MCYKEYSLLYTILFLFYSLNTLLNYIFIVRIYNIRYPCKTAKINTINDEKVF